MNRSDWMISVEEDDVLKVIEGIDEYLGLIEEASENGVVGESYFFIYFFISRVKRSLVKMAGLVEVGVEVGDGVD